MTTPKMEKERSDTPTSGDEGRTLLRDWLASRGTTQRAFAATLGLHEAAVSYYLSGRNVPLRGIAVEIERATEGAVPASSWPEAERGRNALPGPGFEQGTSGHGDGAMSPEKLEGVLLYVATSLGYGAADNLRNHIAALERLAYIGEHRFPDQTWQARCKEVMEERDAALADNAGLERELRAVLAVLWGPDFERRPAELSAQRALSQPHPGAALLEIVHAIRQYRHRDEPDELTTLRRLLNERLRITTMIDPDTHRKALVHAKNEGREEASKYVRSAGNSLLAAEILDLRQPIPCCERDTDSDGNCDRHPRSKRCP